MVSGQFNNIMANLDVTLIVQNKNITYRSWKESHSVFLNVSYISKVTLSKIRKCRER